MSTPTPPRPSRPLTIRQLHAYVGMLIAPTVIFMAFTGLLQVYSLHEAHGDYTPPALVEKMGSLHKDQVIRTEHHEPQAKGPAPAGPAAAEPPHEHGHAHKPKLATLLLKAFFAFVAVALICSTLMGVWMAFQNALKRKVYGALLVIGTVAPAILAAFSS